jgi:hypothetical protein
VEAEFSQPCPANPLFPHGQAAPLPSPKQKDWIAFEPSIVRSVIRKVP